jgi:hypothetical protein
MYRRLFAPLVLLLVMPITYATSSKGSIRDSDQAFGKRFEVKPVPARSRAMNKIAERAGRTSSVMPRYA